MPSAPPRTGARGIELARALHPRAILLDVMMPQMDGWSVLGTLKSDPDLATIPVVMVTFVNEPALSASLGAADTVLKPVEWDQLKSVMERFRGDAGDILVVDDDPDARARLRQVLTRQGWTVSEAGNGQEALDLVLHAPPQLILLDLTMPVMDGFAFLHELRARPGCGDIPVVVLTARDLDAAERHRLPGVSRVLSKGGTDLRQLAGELRSLSPPHHPAPDGAGPVSSLAGTRPPHSQPCCFRKGLVMRVLLVEDHEEIWDFLSRRLKRRGYEVAVATDGQAGLDQARADRPDIVLLDMNLPVLDGWSAARQLKADPAHRQHPDHRADGARHGGRQGEDGSPPAATTTIRNPWTSPSCCSRSRPWFRNATVQA